MEMCFSFRCMRLYGVLTSCGLHAYVKSTEVSLHHGSYAQASDADGKMEPSQVWSYVTGMLYLNVY